MLYLLGGASRAGKSKLARRLLRERNVPYFSLDILMMGLVNGVPEFGHDPDAPSIARGEQVWPLLRAMAVNVLEIGETYLLEGDVLLPKHVAELAGEHGAGVRACFLGYADAEPEAKLQEIRRFSGEANDWLQDQTDAYVRALVDEMIDFSRYLQRECATYRLPYFDGSRDFPSSLDAAFHSLMAPEG